MRHILFIIPSLKTGGTNSSLANFYTRIKDLYDIDVFSMSSLRENSFVFDDCLLPTHRFLSLFELSLKNTNGLQKFIPLFFKIAIKICNAIHIDLRKWVYKSYANNIQRSKKYDVVIGFQEGTATKFASLFSAEKKIAWVHCEYTYYLGNNKSELDTYQAFSDIVCVSDYTAKVFKECYSAIAQNVSFIYNILETDKILKLSNNKIDDTRFNNNGITLISVGRIAPIKQYDKIPLIAKQLKDAGHKFCWYVLGPKTTTEYFDYIEEQIRKNELGEYVKLLGNKTNPYSYISKSDLFVCLSNSEACPMVFCEAFTLSVPVITTDFGSSKEFINIGENGFVCKLDDMGNSISRLLSDTKYYNNLKQGASKNNINTERTIEKLKALLSK